MKVVIIEDDVEIIESVTLCFEIRWPDVDVISATEGVAGTDLVAAESPDIVILDIGLPDIDGFEVCRRIRLFSDVPIVMLTVKDQEFDKVKALDLGADEYITKPFSRIELMARLHAVQRRSALPQCEEAQEPLSIGKLWIDFAAREVRVDQQSIKLTPIEYDLLEVLALNAGRAIPHQTLLEKVWGDEYADCGQYLKVYTQRLRIKLGDDARNPRLLVTERGFGYKLAKVDD